MVRRIRLRHALLALAVGARAGAAIAAGLVFVERTGAANPLDGADVGGFSTPALADLDADGDPDFVAGERYGAFFFFENTGTPAGPTYAERTGAESPFTGLGTVEYSWPAFADLDADLDLDLVSGAHVAPLRYFENVGDAFAPEFLERSGAANPFGALAVANNTAPALADLDADGDVDLVTGDASGVFRWFENAGSAATAAFVERTGAANPLDGVALTGFSTAALGDPDADGDFDFVAGRSNGRFAWFENVGTPASAVYVERVAEESPLDGLVAGTFATPHFGDLDGDDCPELVSGSGVGRFRLFAPEPTPALGGAAALAALRVARRRHRRSAKLTPTPGPLVDEVDADARPLS